MSEDVSIPPATAVLGFSPIPHAVHDAFERGEINQTQFVVLSLMHKWAHFSSGRVDAFSAERVLRFLRQEPTPAAERGMRRQIADLKDAGWFHTDYRHGDKRPYHLWLHNYVVRSNYYMVEENDNVRDPVREQTVLYPCEITPCSKTANCGVRENTSSMSVPNQETSEASARGVEPEPPKAQQRDPYADQIPELLGFIWTLLKFIRFKSWARALLKNYSLLELQYAIGEYLLIERHGDFTEIPTYELNAFFKEGLEIVLFTRRKRYKSAEEASRRPPTGWTAIMKKLEDKEGERP